MLHWPWELHEAVKLMKWDNRYWIGDYSGEIYDNGYFPTVRRKEKETEKTSGIWPEPLLNNYRLNFICEEDPLAQGSAKWIKSGLTSGRGQRLPRDNECPDSEWAAAARTAFQNPSTGAIRFYIGCRQPSDQFPTNFKIANNSRGYTGDHPVEWHTDNLFTFNHRNIRGESVSQFCDPGQAICGFRTNAETNHQLYDCSGINRVEIFCCPFP